MNSGNGLISGCSPIFSHAQDDNRSFKLITSQLIYQAVARLTLQKRLELHYGKTGGEEVSGGRDSCLFNPQKGRGGSVSKKDSTKSRLGRRFVKAQYQT